MRANGLMALAGVAYWQADHETAMATYRDALELFRALGDSFNEAEALFSMSTTANFQDDVVTAEECAGEARRLFEEMDSREGIGRVVVAEGFSSWKRGDYPVALSKYEEGVDIARTLGDEFMALTALIGVGALSYRLGDEERATSVMIEIVGGASEVRNEHTVVWALDLLAAFKVRTSPVESVRLAGAVDSLRRAAGGGMIVESFAIEPARSAASPMLNPEDLKEAWADGGTMTLDEAVSLAYRLGDTPIKHELTR